MFGNHVTAGVLWVKVTFLSACQQTKWRPDRTKDGEIVSQTRVPPVSIPMNYLFSTLRVNTDGKPDWGPVCKTVCHGYTVTLYIVTSMVFRDLFSL